MLSATRAGLKDACISIVLCIPNLPTKSGGNAIQRRTPLSIDLPARSSRCPCQPKACALCAGLYLPYLLPTKKEDLDTLQQYSSSLPRRICLRRDTNTRPWVATRGCFSTTGPKYPKCNAHRTVWMNRDERVARGWNFVDETADKVWLASDKRAA